MTLNLSQAKIGDQLEVLAIDDSQAEVSERLYALGVFPGVAVNLLRAAPMGDPLQIKAGQTLISIRRQEAQSIRVVIQQPANVPSVLTALGST